MTLIQRVRSIAEGRDPESILDHLIAGCLLPLSAGYIFAMTARNAAYSHRWMPSHSLSRPVICVGSLTVGGAGKTPVAASVVEMLREIGHSPAIVSRGYGASKRPRGEPAIVSEGDGPIVGPETAGDEPYFLAGLLRGVPVVVGADRRAAGQLAIESFDSSALVLDDGFQHRRLRRDFDLVLLDASRNPLAACALPRGPYREPFEGLSRASAIVLTRADHSQWLDLWEQRAREYGRGVPVLSVRFSPSALVGECGRGEPEAVESIRGRNVFAVSGIARPEPFRALLEGLGARIVGHKVFHDHHGYSQSDLDGFAGEAERLEAAWIVTTDKDAVKLCGLIQPEIPIQALRIEADFGTDRARLVSLLRECLDRKEAQGG